MPSCRQTLPAYVRIRSRGCVLRASISILVIGFALAGSIGSAAAQYPPPRPPPLGYPPPAPYSYPAGPPRYPGAPPYGDAGVPYEDPDDQLYAPNSELSTASVLFLSGQSATLPRVSVQRVSAATGSRHRGRCFAARISAGARTD